MCSGSSFKDHFDGQVAVIGNFPYNIPARFFFMWWNKESIPEVVACFEGKWRNGSLHHREKKITVFPAL